MRKRRSDSKLWTLDEEIQAQLYELRHVSIRELCKRAKDEFGVCTSIGALSNWLREKHAEAMSESRANAVQFADDITDDASGKVEEAVAIQLGQLAFDAAMMKDPTLLRTAFGLLLDKRRLDQSGAALDLSRRKLELLEKRAAQADEAEAVTESTLTAEEKATRYREIFGMN